MWHNSAFNSSRESTQHDMHLDAKLVNRGLFDSKYISKEKFMNESKK